VSRSSSGCGADDLDDGAKGAPGGSRVASGTVVPENGSVGECSGRGERVDRHRANTGTLEVDELDDAPGAAADRHLGGVQARLTGVADLAQAPLARVAVFIVVHRKIPEPFAAPRES
jgi:hypothetical protein